MSDKKQKNKTMDKIDKNLESKIKELVKNNKIIEALKLIQDELKLGLRNSKELLDKYRKL